MSGTIFAVDGTNQLHRYWHGMQELAAQSFLDMLSAIDQNFRPRQIVCAFDNSEPTFRHVLESSYKTGRAEKEPGLLQQIQAGIDGVVSQGIAAISVSGFESDDVLATIAHKCQQSGHRLVLVTSDKDCRQLLSPNCVMLVSYRKQEHGYVPQWFNEAELQERYGVLPAQWTDWQMLVGDATDSIKGVDGIGDKGATRLLQQAGSYEEIERNPWSVSLTDRKRDAFLRFKARAAIVRKLVTLRRDVPIDWEP